MSKKTVVITGSSRGIGRACAILFAKNNYNVVINKVFRNKIYRGIRCKYIIFIETNKSVSLNYRGDK